VHTAQGKLGLADLGGGIVAGQAGPPAGRAGRTAHDSPSAARSTGGNDCVEVAQTRESCLVRDSKQPNGIRLPVGRDAWATFTRGIKNGTAVP
jgi:hypothetical protein